MHRGGGTGRCSFGFSHLMPGCLVLISQILMRLHRFSEIFTLHYRRTCTLGTPRPPLASPTFLVRHRQVWYPLQRQPMHLPYGVSSVKRPRRRRISSGEKKKGPGQTQAVEKRYCLKKNTPGGIAPRRRSYLCVCWEVPRHILHALRVVFDFMFWWKAVYL